MEEEIKKNPADLNGDGKVSFSEKLQAAAGKVADKAKETYGKAKERTEEVIDKINSADLDGDGKVTFKEKVQFTG
jgi:Ca2+-binding EF-hand superfamily protein